MKSHIKNFSALVIILGMSALFTACEKDAIEPTSTSKPVNTKFDTTLPIDNPNRPDRDGPVGNTQPVHNQK